jgi:membrane-associated progesterone receptor component
LMAARLVAFSALLVGIAGIFLSLYPSVLESTESDCPWLMRHAPSLYSALSLSSLKAMLGLGRSLPDGPVDPSDGLRWFTEKELSQYDGSDESKPIMLAVKGFVFDVTEKGSQFYGKGKVWQRSCAVGCAELGKHLAPTVQAYNVFAGRDSTRALTLGSLEAKDVSSTDLSDFTPQQQQAAEEQRAFYAGKYTLVGKLRAAAAAAGEPGR